MATTTLTLTDFLRARIAEDEAVAQLRQERATSAPAEKSAMAVTYGRTHFVADPTSPTRTLTECKAKRHIVEIHTSSEEWTPGHIPGRFCEACAVWDEETDEGQPPTVPWPCPTLRAVAAVYADHPDYREEWRP